MLKIPSKPRVVSNLCRYTRLVNILKKRQKMRPKDKQKESLKKPKPRAFYVQGFTLAELLISLAILGVIATFTIPKILVAQQNSQYNAMAKEAAAMISEAYQKATQEGIITASSKPSDLMPYMNYVSIDSSGNLIDLHPNWGGGPPTADVACNGSWPCIKLHNGSTLMFVDTWTFGGTSTMHSIGFLYDPDSKSAGSSSQTAPGKSVFFTLYYNGQITTAGLRKAGTCNSGGCGNGPGPNDPSWFSW